MFHHDNVSLVESSKVEKACSGRDGDLVSHIKSAVQENTEVTNHIRWWNTVLWVRVQILCFLVIVQSASVVKPNE